MSVTSGMNTLTCVVCSRKHNFKLSQFWHVFDVFYFLVFNSIISLPSNCCRFCHFILFDLWFWIGPRYDGFCATSVVNIFVAAIQ